MFFRKLKPGGVLMLGHSESLLHVESPFSLKPLSRGIAYQKPEASS
jgi:chemotaxis methyl-accepting protein methylase